jgi:tetratricopeptide (TPR) repeat protein
MSELADRYVEQAAEARRDGRLADAKNDLTEAIGLLREEGLAYRLAPLLRELGEIDRNLGDKQGARECYEEAVAIYRESDQSFKLAHTLRHLGDVHREAKALGLAEPCYREALTLYRNRTETPPLELANAIRSMAVLKEETGDVEQAKSLWTEARELYSKVRVGAGVAESEERLAKLAG